MLMLRKNVTLNAKSDIGHNKRVDRISRAAKLVSEQEAPFRASREFYACLFVWGIFGYKYDLFWFILKFYSFLEYLWTLWNFLSFSEWFWVILNYFHFYEFLYYFKLFWSHYYSSKLFWIHLSYSDRLWFIWSSQTYSRLSLVYSEQFPPTML